MTGTQQKLFPMPGSRYAHGGFTLVELMVGIVVTAIVTIGVFSIYTTNRETVMTQRQTADMQQQLRGSLYIMEREIRAAGFDPDSAGTAAAPAGVTDVRRYNIVADPDAVGTSDLNVNGSPALTVTFDLDSDGVLEQSTYLLYDIDADGIDDLARFTVAGGYELLAEGIQAMGLAYAIDNDRDGNLDTIDPGNPASNIIWAVDSDNDNLLDANLDVDDDGDIDIDDLNAGAVALAAAPVALDRIRMVRIWLLCRSTREAQATISEIDTGQFFVIGHQDIARVNDNFRRRTLEMSVKCRNLGL